MEKNHRLGVVNGDLSAEEVNTEFDWVHERINQLSEETGVSTDAGSTSASSGSTSDHIHVFGHLGRGSTNTGVCRFSGTNLSSGTGISYNKSPSLGDYFTVTKNGVYSISFSGNRAAGGVQMAITINSIKLSSDPATPITYNEGLRDIFTTSGAGAFGRSTWCGPLSVGDVIRAQIDTAAAMVNDYSTNFVITRVGSF